MAMDRNAAPARMKAIMHEVRVAPSRLSTKVLRSIDPVSHDSASAPNTPNDAASVGVATPP